MKLLTATLFSLNITVFGCEFGNKKESETTERELDTTTLANDGHTSENAVDWNGSYEGVIPCADCPGIETKITVNKDKTYELSVLYQDREKKPTITKGTFTWDASGSVIKLDKVGTETQYKVGEGRIWMLDREGKRIEGAMAEKYILNKTQ
ncbi:MULTISPECIES: copper resistance protein NlpE [Flavobacterium]|uniref:copper resistance protein NlpE n=1 Tax=Flavobacterium TaxID=237 RepID=UPI001FCC6AB9|nr:MULTISPECIES: copper resistance protein NlpE [Flavobacterium]UOK43060.1 copper resistance protein NlpE [Flavobacterium enshiense]